MAVKDIASEIKIVPSLLPQTITTGEPHGAAVDTADYNAVAIELICGAQSGTTNKFQIQECETTTDGSFTAVAEAELDADAYTTLKYNLSITTANDNLVHRWRYRGKMRYVRVISVADATGGLIVAANVILGYPKSGPVAAWDA